MFQVLFWFSVGFVGYAYVGYPLILLALAALRSRPVSKGSIRPRITFIITAYNEERRIAAKLQNTLQQSYPPSQLQILVASDCSNDGTDEIVRRFGERGISLIRASERKGKEAAQKIAVQAAKGDILVFSDVATVLQPNALANIVENFADPTVGCVSSEDRFLERDGTFSGEGAYIRYEMFLRRLETEVNTVVGLSGSFFAARREVCAQWADDLQSDFNTLLNSIKLGMRGISDPASIGYYQNLSDERKEFERKVRTILRGLSVFMTSWRMVNPIRYGLFSWQLLSHKLCRWLVPFALIVVLFSNALLASESAFYRVTFIAQVVFYCLALSSLMIKMPSNSSYFKIPAFFVLVNWSILTAWYRYFRGDRMVAWEPSKR